MLVIGINPILETLKYNSGNINKIFILKDISNSKINDIVNKAAAKNITVEYYKTNEFSRFLEKKDKSEGLAQGVIAEVEEFKYCELDELLSITGSSTIILLDEVQDPHNLGAIIRTACASGINKLIISEKNSVKVNHTVIKTSAGATNHINICLAKNIYKIINELKSKNFKITGTDMNSKVKLYDYHFDDKSVIIFGSEGYGIRKNIKNLCDDLIRIPVDKKIESLNVSVSAGIIFYEIYRQKIISKID